MVQVLALFVPCVLKPPVPVQLQCLHRGGLAAALLQFVVVQTHVTGRLCVNIEAGGAGVGSFLRTLVLGRLLHNFQL